MFQAILMLGRSVLRRVTVGAPVVPIHLNDDVVIHDKASEARPATAYASPLKGLQLTEALNEWNTRKSSVVLEILLTVSDERKDMVISSKACALSPKQELLLITSQV